MRRFFICLIAVSMLFTLGLGSVSAQPAPSMVSPYLKVRTVASGLSQPLAIEFLGPNDFLVTEKGTGRVQRIVDGQLHSTVLDLPVNSASERGLLGMALHPDFPANPGVYLYWTESSTGADTTATANTPLLGNRVDRFVWDGSSLTFDQNIVRLRALQPPNPPIENGQFGNHNGGVIRFGPDGKLYIFIGDNGRRGNMQNLPCGPTPTCPGPTVPDDQFGGPAPDDAHLTGVMLRLNDDGTAPSDNPFYGVGAAVGGEVGANLQKLHSYGHRNAIGMDFDPQGGHLWLAENGDDTFSELNRVDRGMNGGWIQIMGPLERFDQFRESETGPFRGLQQTRWSPDNLQLSAEAALEAMYMLPGAHYSDPEFSWRFEVAPAGLGFIDGSALGPQYDGDMITGAARNFLEGGQLFRFKLHKNRRTIVPDDPRLADLVADNLAKFDITESESLRFGRDFGVATEIETGPNGNLYVVSLSLGAVFEIYRDAPTFDEAHDALDALAAGGGITEGLEEKIRHALDTAEDWLDEENRYGPALSHLERAVRLLEWQIGVIEDKGKTGQGDPEGLRELADLIADLLASLR